MALDDIASLEAQTQVPRELLRRYIKREGQCGVCWSIESAEAFCAPVPFLSNGQGVKGAPRRLEQPGVEQRVWAARRLVSPTESELTALYRKWKQRQIENRAERLEQKRLLFGASSGSLRSRSLGSSNLAPARERRVACAALI